MLYFLLLLKDSLNRSLFDNGKEFLSGKISLISMISVPTFADVGAPNQRALNEHTNGLLRKDGLGKI